MRRIPFLMIFTFLLLTSLSCCKEKGCTDNKACNFDLKAEKDDGSCEYCDCDQGSLSEDAESVNINLYSNTGLFGVMTLSKDKKTPRPSCGGLEECENYVKIRNITNKTITFSYNVYYSLNAGTWQYQNTVYKLAPGQTSEKEPVNKRCGRLSGATIQVVLTSGLVEE